MKLALCLALLGAQAFAGEIIYGSPPAGVIPHVVDGDGWKTIFTLVNLGNAPASFTLQFYADDGTPAAFPTTSGTSPTITGTLAAGARPPLKPVARRCRSRKDGPPSTRRALSAEPLSSGALYPASLTLNRPTRSTSIRAAISRCPSII